MQGLGGRAKDGAISLNFSDPARAFQENDLSDSNKAIHAGIEYANFLRNSIQSMCQTG